MTDGSIMRIGILQTDSVREEFQPEFGDYPGMFERVIGEAGRSPDLQFSTYDVRTGNYPERLDACDGYLITGSRNSVYDDEPWIARLGEFIVTLDEHRRPLVGICFGHQLIAHVLGGETRPAEAGWAVGVHEAQVLASYSWMTQEEANFSLIASHKDQVTSLPARARLFAGNSFCPYGGYTIEGHILTFQGHPEFEPGYAARLMGWRREILGEETYGKGMESLAGRIDSAHVARWILQFFEGARSTAAESDSAADADSGERG